MTRPSPKCGGLDARVARGDRRDRGARSPAQGTVGLPGGARPDHVDLDEIASASSARGLERAGAAVIGAWRVASRRAIATAAGVALLLSTAGCAVGIPHAGGEPVAPLAPNHLWQPPRSAQGDDPPRGETLPPQLAARVDSLTLPEIVDLALRNNPATRESWAQAQAYSDAYGAARAGYFPTIDGLVTAIRSDPGGASAVSPSSALAAAQSTLEPAVSLSTRCSTRQARGKCRERARNGVRDELHAHATIQSTILGVEQPSMHTTGARRCSRLISLLARRSGELRCGAEEGFGGTRR